MRGSSPLARGGHGLVGDLDPAARLIPARAGRTVRCSGRTLAATAHPRSRGADINSTGGYAGAWGSSPLARGGPPATPRDGPGPRLIPARAGRTSPAATSTPRQRAHPRSRGADSSAGTRMRSPSGSSPLARGGPLDLRQQCDVTGLIPARAGRTSTPATRPSCRWAHPRSRGADAAAPPMNAGRRGSSPLARGGPLHTHTARWVSRLIPARAGRTPWRPGISPRTWAHPRSRGADSAADAAATTGTGSSPLARGGRCLRRGHPRPRGLIPARAGRTNYSARSRCGQRAHPRSRGADVGSLSTAVAPPGSSPLARGGRACVLPCNRGARLIPARAGRTSPTCCRRGRRWAHPRSRGADYRYGRLDLAAPGSSPLARGGLAAVSTRLHGPRLIPARAGRTSPTAASTCRHGAHPRSRGADALAGVRVPAVMGSSPLARGGRGERPGDDTAPGLIPARAGRTMPVSRPAATKQAHPRSRGADARLLDPQGQPLGSSPLARGGRRRRGRSRRRTGLIPARAGRT